MASKNNGQGPQRVPPEGRRAGGRHHQERRREVHTAGNRTDGKPFADLPEDQRPSLPGEPLGPSFDLQGPFKAPLSSTARSGRDSPMRGLLARTGERRGDLLLPRFPGGASSLLHFFGE